METSLSAGHLTTSVCLFSNRCLQPEFHSHVRLLFSAAQFDLGTRTPSNLCLTHHYQCSCSCPRAGSSGNLPSV